MDNYKIKVKEEAASTEAQELFVQLGFEKTGFSCDKYPCYLATWEGGFSDYDLDSLNVSRERKELTLPQLRDLVVLKRNDINDANWETEGGDQIFNDSNDKSYIYRSDGWDELQRHEMRQAMWEKPKAIAKPQDPALISGADAIAHAIKGIFVEFLYVGGTGDWENFNIKSWSVDDLQSCCYKFRLKPQTIKLELELTKPFEPNIEDWYFFVSTENDCGYSTDKFEGLDCDVFQTQFGAYRTVNEVEQVVEQIRKIRGTNS